MTVTAAQVVILAAAQVGDRYVLGVEASPNNPDPTMFDCSELVEWVCARLGVTPPMPDLAYRQAAHCRLHGTTIPVAEAVATAGALLFKDLGAGGSGGQGNHVAISLGDGQTIEARGAAYGVGSFAASGRGWNYAALIPGVSYPQRKDAIMTAVYSLFTPVGYHDVLAVGPGVPFHVPNPTVAQELVDLALIAGTGPGTSYTKALTTISVGLWTAIAGFSPSDRQ